MVVERERFLKISKYIILFAIICISFFLYSSEFYPLLNSDDGVTILMTHFFNLKTDLYFWGQDRYGSILPLIGQFFYKSLGLSGVLSESFSHYLIISMGFFSLASFLNDYKLKIALAIVWFFPPFHMLDFLRNTLGLEYSLLCIGLYFLRRTCTIKYLNNKRLIVYSISLFCLSLALWVSDLAIVSIFLIVFFVIIYKYVIIDRKAIFRMDDNFYKYFLITSAMLAITIGFILLAKNTSEKSDGYIGFANLFEIKTSINIILLSLKNIILFKANEPGTSLYSYGTLLIIILAIVNLKISMIGKKRKLLIAFFTIQAAAILFVVVISNWTYKCEVGRRYFVSIYAAFWMAILLMVDSRKNVNNRVSSFQILLLLITLITGGLGTQYNIRFIWPGTSVPTIKQIEEFKHMGKIGIVANYWNSYVISCTDPVNIIATPHQGDMIRNKKFVREVFDQSRIYVIRDGWLNEFPDILNQFGYKLKKSGKEQYIGGCYICKYSILNRDTP